MKYCAKCNAKIPYRIVIDGKSHSLQRRKFCLDCSPFNNHNTKNLTETETIVDGKIQCQCKYCDQLYFYNPGGMLKDVCNTCRSLARRYQVKKKMLDYKGNVCSICGYSSDNWRNLSFHHIDPETKKFNIATESYQKSWGDIQVELDKCILVCHLCHNDLHEKETEHIKKKMILDGLF